MVHFWWNLKSRSFFMFNTPPSLILPLCLAGLNMTLLLFLINMTLSTWLVLRIKAASVLMSSFCLLMVWMELHRAAVGFHEYSECQSAVETWTRSCDFRSVEKQKFIFSPALMTFGKLKLNVRTCVKDVCRCLKVSCVLMFSSRYCRSLDCEHLRDLGIFWCSFFVFVFLAER